VLGGGGYAFWEHEQGGREYYVGTQDGHVAIFHGTDRSLLGVALSRAVLLQRNDLEVRWLGDNAKAKVTQTIPVASQAAADTVIKGLLTQVDACGHQWYNIVDWQQEPARQRVRDPEPAAPSAASCASASALNVPVTGTG
jgi:hypothetical protein